MLRIHPYISNYAHGVSYQEISWVYKVPHLSNNFPWCYGVIRWSMVPQRKKMINCVVVFLKTFSLITIFSFTLVWIHIYCEHFFFETFIHPFNNLRVYLCYYLLCLLLVFQFWRVWWWITISLTIIYNGILHLFVFW